ncbi:MAG: DUF1292 domain-containing protein [Oscillospiraceae bacterium]|nr:DUF1292 domain-containing protein [Oscillospiraceae bacterium]
MAENDNVTFDENEGTVTLADESGETAVFHFYEETYIPLDDEEGVTTEFECISSMDYKGAVYYALLPKSDDDEEEPDEFVVLKGEENDEELLLTSIDDEEENQKIGELFLKALFSLEDMSDDGEILQ